MGVLGSAPKLVSGDHGQTFIDDSDTTSSSLIYGYAVAISRRSLYLEWLDFQAGLPSPQWTRTMCLEVTVASNMQFMLVSVQAVDVDQVPCTDSQNRRRYIVSE